MKRRSHCRRGIGPVSSGRSGSGTEAETNRCKPETHGEPETSWTDAAVRHPGRTVRRAGLRAAAGAEGTGGCLERGGRRTGVPPDPHRRGAAGGLERDGGAPDAAGRAGGVPEAGAAGRVAAGRAGDADPRHPVPRRPDRTAGPEPAPTATTPAPTVRRRPTRRAKRSKGRTGRDGHRDEARRGCSGCRAAGADRGSRGVRLSPAGRLRRFEPCLLSRGNACRGRDRQSRLLAAASDLQDRPR